MNSIDYLNWDSSFFGFDIYRVLDGKLIEDVSALENLNDKLGHLEVLLSICNVERIREYQKWGFEFSALQLDYKKSLEEVGDEKVLEGLVFRKCHEMDLNSLVNIAENSFYETRFSVYPYSQSQAKKLYGAWVEKAVAGTFDDECFCISDVEGILGFVTIRYVEENFAKIGLIAVKNSARRRGVGRALCKNAFKVMRDRGCCWVKVATQGNNFSANNLYINCGFNLEGIYAWYYRTKR